MSFKSFLGVSEDMEVHHKVGNGVRGLGQPLGSFPESFMKIKHLEPCQDSPLPSSLFMSFKSLPGFLEDMEVPDKVGNDVWGLGQPL